MLLKLKAINHSIPEQETQLEFLFCFEGSPETPEAALSSSSLCPVPSSHQRYHNDLKKQSPEEGNLPMDLHYIDKRET